MQVTIDRIEGVFAVVELPDRRMVNMPLELLPGAKECSVIDIIINEPATEDQVNSVNERFDRLKKRKEGTDEN